MMKIREPLPELTKQPEDEKVIEEPKIIEDVGKQKHKRKSSTSEAYQLAYQKDPHSGIPKRRLLNLTDAVSCI